MDTLVVDLCQVRSGLWKLSYEYWREGGSS
jgi:hypothetical protein